MRNIKANLDMLDANRDYIALGMLSDPGLSKSSQVQQWAEEHGRRVFELIISQRMPSEISGMPMPNNKTSKMEIYDFDTLLEMKDGDILFFDEFTNGNIQTLNACLTLIQERRMLSGKPLPSVMIVAAGNPQGSCDLLPQTKQRFIWTTVSFDPCSWVEYIWRKHGVIPCGALVDRIIDQYKSGFDRVRYNYMTARTAENFIRIELNGGISDELKNTVASSFTYQFNNIEGIGKMKECHVYPVVKNLLDILFDHADKNDPERILRIAYGLREAKNMEAIQQFMQTAERGLFGKPGDMLVARTKSLNGSKEAVEFLESRNNDEQD